MSHALNFLVFELMRFYCIINSLSMSYLWPHFMHCPFKTTMFYKHEPAFTLHYEHIMWSDLMSSVIHNYCIITLSSKTLTQSGQVLIKAHDLTQWHLFLLRNVSLTNAKGWVYGDMPTTTNMVSDKQLLQCSGPIIVLKVKMTTTIILNKCNVLTTSANLWYGRCSM
jgi:hypothetical protein